MPGIATDRRTPFGFEFRMNPVASPTVAVQPNPQIGLRRDHAPGGGHHPVHPPADNPARGPPIEKPPGPSASARSTAAPDRRRRFANPNWRANNALRAAVLSIGSIRGISGGSVTIRSPLKPAATNDRRSARTGDRDAIEQTGRDQVLVDRPVCRSPGQIGIRPVAAEHRQRPDTDGSQDAKRRSIRHPNPTPTPHRHAPRQLSIEVAGQTGLISTRGPAASWRGDRPDRRGPGPMCNDAAQREQCRGVTTCVGVPVAAIRRAIVIASAARSQLHRRGWPKMMGHDENAAVQSLDSVGSDGGSMSRAGSSTAT